VARRLLGEGYLPVGVGVRLTEVRRVVEVVGAPESARGASSQRLLRRLRRMTRCADTYVCAVAEHHLGRLELLGAVGHLHDALAAGDAGGQPHADGDLLRGLVVRRHRRPPGGGHHCQGVPVEAGLRDRCVDVIVWAQLELQRPPVTVGDADCHGDGLALAVVTSQDPQGPLAPRLVGEGRGGVGGVAAGGAGAPRLLGADEVVVVRVLR